MYYLWLWNADKKFWDEVAQNVSEDTLVALMQQRAKDNAQNGRPQEFMQVCAWEPAFMEDLHPTVEQS